MKTLLQGNVKFFLRYPGKCVCTDTESSWRLFRQCLKSTSHQSRFVWNDSMDTTNWGYMSNWRWTLNLKNISWIFNGPLKILTHLTVGIIIPWKTASIVWDASSCDCSFSSGNLPADFIFFPPLPNIRCTAVHSWRGNQFGSDNRLRTDPAAWSTCTTLRRQQFPDGSDRPCSFTVSSTLITL